MPQPQPTSNPEPKLVRLKNSNLSFEVLQSDRFPHKIRDPRDGGTYLVQRNRFA